jgi:four helix bundle protein
MNSLNQDQHQNILDRTFRFAVRITKLCIFLDSRGGTGRVLGSQVVRAGTSVGSQVEEAQAAESTADFISKMSIGLKEARETHYRLRILEAANLVRPARLGPLIQEAEEIKRVVGAILVRTRANTRSNRPRRR